MSRYHWAARETPSSSKICNWMMQPSNHCYVGMTGCIARMGSACNLSLLMLLRSWGPQSNPCSVPSTSPRSRPTSPLMDLNFAHLRYAIQRGASLDTLFFEFCRASRRQDGSVCGVERFEFPTEGCEACGGRFELPQAASLTLPLRYHLPIRLI